MIIALTILSVILIVCLIIVFVKINRLCKKLKEMELKAYNTDLTLTRTILELDNAVKTMKLMSDMIVGKR